MNINYIQSFNSLNNPDYLLTEDNNKDEENPFFIKTTLMVISFTSILAYIIFKAFKINSTNKSSSSLYATKIKLKAKTHDLKKELNWKWEDLQKLAANRLGLRHVSSFDRQEKERKEGINYGCSLSLCPQPLVKREIYQKMPELPAEEKKKLLENFTKCVDQFIKKSIIYDMRERLELNKTKILDVVQVVKRCHFSLVNYSDNLSNPVDLNSWGRGLGRFPKEEIRAKNIYPISAITIEDLNLGDQELQGIIKTPETGDNLFKTFVKTYRTMIILHLRSLDLTAD